MSTSNEIPDRDFERQSTNRTQARAFFDTVMSVLNLIGESVKEVVYVAFPPVPVVFGM